MATQPLAKDPQPIHKANSLQVKPIEFVEKALAAAGTYTCTLALPAGTYIFDFDIHNLAAWGAGSSALLDGGDDYDLQMFYKQLNLKTPLPAADIKDYTSAGRYTYGGGHGGGNAINTTGPTLFTQGARTLTFKVTTVGTPGITGDTMIFIVTSKPVVVIESKAVLT